MSNNKLKAGIAMAAAMTTMSSLAVTVIPGHAPLSLTYETVPVGTDFNDTDKAFKETYGTYKADPNSSNNMCGKYEFPDETCMNKYGLSFVEDDQDGTAVNIQPYDSSATNPAYDQQVSYYITGELPLYSERQSNEEALLSYQLGLIPGGLAEGNTERVPGETTSTSFTTSVDFKVSDDTSQVGSAAIVKIGHIGVGLRYLPDGSNEVFISLPMQSAITTDGYIFEQFDSPVSGSAPVNTWMKLETSFDTDTNTVSISITDKSTGNLFFDTVIANVYGLQSQEPLSATISPLDLDSASALYHRSITVDNYTTSKSISSYLLDHSPLTQRLSTIMIGNFESTSNGVKVTHIEIDEDNTRVPESIISGKLGNDVNIAVIDDVTVFTTLTIGEVTAAFGAHADEFYKGVLVAQGEGQDYLVVDPSLPETPTEALQAAISIDATDNNRKRFLQKICRSISNAKSGNLTKAEKRLTSASKKLTSLANNYPSIITTTHENDIAAWIDELEDLLENNAVVYPRIEDQLPSGVCPEKAIQFENIIGAQIENNNASVVISGGDYLSSGSKPGTYQLSETETAIYFKINRNDAEEVTSFIGFGDADLLSYANNFIGATFDLYNGEQSVQFYIYDSSSELEEMAEVSSNALFDTKLALTVKQNINGTVTVKLYNAEAPGTAALDSYTSTATITPPENARGVGMLVSPSGTATLQQWNKPSHEIENTKILSH